MNNGFHWIYVPGHSLALVKGDVTLLDYRFGLTAPKPYFHPLRTPGGTILTSFQPSDHVWHRGLWFAWKYINGVNYWEETMDGDGALVSEGRTVPTGHESVTFGEDGSAILRHGLAYVSPEGNNVLLEDRKILIHPLIGQDLVIDLGHNFRVGDAPVTLSATPETDATPWGGYSGLGLRAARSLISCRVVNDNGQTGAEANGAPAVWVDLSGMADGGPADDRAAGLALIDHPSNPRHPSPSYVYYDSQAFGYIGPSLLRHEPMALEAGETLRLAYRAIAHDETVNAVRLGAMAAEFGATHPFDHRMESETR